MTTQAVQLTLAVTATQWFGGLAVAAIVTVNLAYILAAVARARHRRYYTDY